MCLFLGLLVKRSAFALGFLILWWGIFENLIVRISAWKLFGKEGSESVMRFMPLEAMSNLIVEPVTKFKAVQSLSTQLGTDLSRDYAVHWYDLLIVLGWTAIFIYLSYALLKKRDL